MTHWEKTRTIILLIILIIMGGFILYRENDEIRNENPSLKSLISSQK